MSFAKTMPFLSKYSCLYIEVSQSSNKKYCMIHYAMQKVHFVMLREQTFLNAKCWHFDFSSAAGLQTCCE